MWGGVQEGMAPDGWLLFEAGWAGVLACLAWMNLSWYRRARQGLLLWSAVACTAAVGAVLVSLVGLIDGPEAPWTVLVALRAIMVGVVLAAFVLCLHSLVPLPGVRIAIVVIVVLRLLFVAGALLSNRPWSLPEGVSSPVYSPISRWLFAVPVAVFIGYVVLAMARLPRRTRVELGVATVLAVLPVAMAVAMLGGWQLEVIASLWMVPLAVLVGVWSGRHVTQLRGSLSTALADRDAAQQRVRRQARTDTRTGLLNHRGIGELLDTRLDARVDGETVAVMVVRVDLDVVRSHEGEVAVDALAYQVAHGLRRQTPAGDVARLGESAFCVVVPWPADRPVSGLAALCARASDRFRGGTGLRPGTAIQVGIAVAEPESSADEMLRRAEVAAEHARQRGHATAVYAPHLDQEQAHRVRLGRLLTRAVAAGEIEVHYQPVLDVRTGRRAEVEALARWRHGGRLHQPDEWIPLAEQLGLMSAIGEEVLRVAVRDQVRLGCPVAVNVSPAQLVAPGFARSALRIVGDCRPGERIVLEVTEDAIMVDFDRALRVVRELRAAGFRVALDDFGSKHSSLSRVAQLPFDVLKIDRSFVRRLDTAQGRAMVTAIQALTGALGKVSVAEGVETAAELAVLREIGCDLVQGFLLGRPEPMGFYERSTPVGPPSVGAVDSDLLAPPEASLRS